MSLSPTMSLNSIWEGIFSSRSWGRYPNENIVRFVMRRFGKVPKEERKSIKFLEVGCGPGPNLVFLAREGFTVHGVDGSESSVNQATNYLDESVGKGAWLGSVSLCDFTTALHFENEYFDVIIDCEAIYANPWELSLSAMSHIRRVLKKNGCFLSLCFATGTVGEGTGIPIDDHGGWICTEGPCNGMGYTRFTSYDDIPKLFDGFNLEEINLLDRSIDGVSSGRNVREWLIVMTNSEVKHAPSPYLEVFGHGKPVLVIAEAGVNHNGDVNLAHMLIDAANAAGADVIKFQTFVSEKVISVEAPKAKYQQTTTGEEGSQLDMVRPLELSKADFAALVDHCHRVDISFMSTPFDDSSVDLLDELGVDCFKIGSGDLNNWPLLEYVASKGKPMIISTGMSFMNEVRAAVRVVREAGCPEVVLLHCVSSYPTDERDVNLSVLRTMSSELHLPIGFSDHTRTTDVAVAAVMAGACCIEKHFTLDRTMNGPDHSSSLEPSQFAEMIKGIRRAEVLLGDGIKRPRPCEEDVRFVARRSLTAACNIDAGQIITRDMLIPLRPACGIAPEQYRSVIGRRMGVTVEKGSVLTWDDIDTT